MPREPIRESGRRVHQIQVPPGFDSEHVRQIVSRYKTSALARVAARSSSAVCDSHPAVESDIGARALDLLETILDSDGRETMAVRELREIVKNSTRNTIAKPL